MVVVASPSAGPPVADGLDVAVVRFPWIANITDLDAVAVEPGVTVRLVRSAAELGHPDVVVLPGTKSTVADLMTPAVFSLGPEAPVQRVVQDMVALNVHQLFVVDRAGVLVGVITPSDVLRRFDA